MKQKLFYFLCSFLFPAIVFSQGTPNQPVAQNANQAKDAQVDVTISDARTGQVLNNEIVVFRSRVNSREYQGLSDASGKFTLRLPTGSVYDIYILGFQDSVSYNFLDIPALKSATASYKDPFKVNIQFEPPKAFVLENCNFETGKAELQPTAYAVLDDLVDYLKRKQDEKVEIGGHTDDVGKEDANLILSQNRANTVRAYLLMKGIAPERVTAKGYGMEEPVAENNTAEGRAQNRRTEVKIL